MEVIVHLDLLFGFFIQNIESDRAENNSRSTDIVWPDRRLDPSNSHLAGHFDRSLLDMNILFSI